MQHCFISKKSVQIKFLFILNTIRNQQFYCENHCSVLLNYCGDIIRGKGSRYLFK